MKMKAPQDTTLLEVLQLLSPESSKNTLRSWVEKGRVIVEGRALKKGSTPIKKGQLVTVGKRTSFVRHDVEILHEDEHIVVINKPEGLLSVSTDFEENLTAHGVLKRRFHSKRVYPVHRLDRETSGVMVFAYTEHARAHLKKLFQAHDIQREYVALVEGVLEKPSGTWRGFLKEDASFFVKPTLNADEGQIAITHYHVVKKRANTTFLRLKLETGRKNQIRVHCQIAGHPVVGDQKYGAQTNPFSRLCLHAQKLAFTHPQTGKLMKFEVPLPEMFF
jgi:23S rRNA pseudouridine1911/1915/1917 synthase